jgi:hypothetical protein
VRRVARGPLSCNEVQRGAPKCKSLHAYTCRNAVSTGLEHPASSHSSPPSDTLEAPYSGPLSYLRLRLWLSELPGIHQRGGRWGMSSRPRSPIALRGQETVPQPSPR